MTRARDAVGGEDRTGASAVIVPVCLNPLPQRADKTVGLEMVKQAKGISASHEQQVEVWSTSASQQRRRVERAGHAAMFRRRQARHPRGRTASTEVVGNCPASPSKEPPPQLPFHHHRDTPHQSRTHQSPNGDGCPATKEDGREGQRSLISDSERHRGSGCRSTSTAPSCNALRVGSSSSEPADRSR